MNKLIKMIFKFAFAFGIIFYLLRSGKLDLSLIQKSISSGYLWILCPLLILLQDTLSGLRWKWLLKTQSKEDLPFAQIARVTWIGLFFNSFLPGAVTGDIIKLVYARDLDKNLSKTFLVTSVFIDRILGLTGLLLILGTSSLIYYSEITSTSSQMTNLVHFNLLLVFGAICFVGTMFLPKRIQSKLLDFSKLVPVLGNKITKTLKQFWIMGSSKRVVLKSILFSVFLQLFSFVAFYLISSPFYSKPIPLSMILSFIPIGFVAVAIPISPAGLGVGHVIFEQLFKFAGIAGGASFFNLYFVFKISMNAIGVIPYLLSTKKHDLSETSEFEAES